MATLLLVQPSLTGIGGVEKVLPVVARELTRHGFGIETLSFYDPVTAVPDFSRYHHTLAEDVTSGLTAKVKKMYRRARAIMAIIAERKPTALIVSTHGSSLIVLALKRLGLVPVPVLVYVHQALSASDFGYVPLTKFLYPSADGFIAVSSGVAKEVRTMIRDPRIPVVVAYNPIEREVSPARLATLEARQRPVFITASRLEPIKGVDQLVRVMITYFKTHPGELWIFGDGSARALLEQSVAEAELSARIRFFGAVPSVYPYLEQADVYLSLALHEAFGLSLVEALSCGLPLVCSDVPYGPREIMQVASEDVLSYPYLTPYGALISLKQEPVEMHADFATACERALTLSPETRTARLARARDFSPAETVAVIVQLIKNTTPI